MEQAAEVAVAKYGGTVRSVEDDHYRGTPAWEVELRGTAQGDLEVKIDKSNGSVLSVEHDD